MRVWGLFRSALAAPLMTVLAASSVCAQTPPYGVAYQKPGETPHNIKIEIPANAPSITSDFRSEWAGEGGRHRSKMPVVGEGAFAQRSGVWHSGIDILGPKDAPVIAAADGYVSQIGETRASGPFIMIVHGDKVNASGYLATRYVHLHRTLVLFGQFVRRGEQIATMGWVGPWSLRSHLHFEVFRHNVGMVQSRLNPHEYWIGGEGKIVCFDARKSYPSELGKFTYPVPCKGEPYLKPGQR